MKTKLCCKKTGVFPLLRVVLFFSLSIFCLLQAAPTFTNYSYAADANYIGNYAMHSQSGNAITITCANNNKVKVVVCTPYIIRVVLGDGGSFETDFSHAVITYDWPAVSYTLENQSSDLVITTTDLYVRIVKNPLRFEFYDKNVTLLNRDNKGLRLTSMNNEAEVMSHQVSKVLDASEHFYGCGERQKYSLDQRGRFIKNWNAGTAQFAEPYDYLCYGDIPFYLSNKGYGMYLDNSSESYFDFGKAVSNEVYFGIYADEVDYYFIAGPSFKKILDGYTQLTGRPFLPPKYMCAYQASRWSYDTRAVVEDIASTFRAQQIPCDALWLDGPYTGWWNNNTNFSVTFSSRYPNPQDMVNTIHSKGFKLCLLENVNHMTTGDQYQTGVTNKYYVAKDANGTPWTYNAWDKLASEVDFRVPGASAWWGSLHHPLWDLGFDAFWIDENDGEFGEIGTTHWDKYYWNKVTGARDRRGWSEHDATPLLSNEALYTTMKQYFKDKAMNKRAWTFARGKYSGMQRCAWTWSADVPFSSWDVMRQQLRWEGNMGMGSIVYGSDIPGCDAIPSDQAYLRWFQMECFNFFTRTHGSSRPKEPWNFPTVAGYVKNWIEWKYKMMPYIYTGAYDMNQMGTPIHRPLVFDYTTDGNVTNMEDEFMFGDWMLVAPVVNGNAGWISDVSRNVYLPAGTWIDYKDGKTIHTGPLTIIKYPADLNTVPIFVKAGAIIPMQPLMQYMGEKPIDLVTLDVYPSGNSSYIMYEDDGTSYNYETGAWVKTKFDCSASGNNVKVTVNARQCGGGAFTPAARNYMLKVHNRSSAIVAVSLNGALLTKTTYNALSSGTKGWSQDSANQIAWVRVADSGTKMDIALIVDQTGVGSGISLAPRVAKMSIKKIAGNSFMDLQELGIGDKSITIYDLSGRLIKRAVMRKINIDVSKDLGIPQGAYIIQAKAIIK